MTDSTDRWTCDICRKVVTLILDMATGKRYCVDCLPTAEQIDVELVRNQEVISIPIQWTEIE